MAATVTQGAYPVNELGEIVTQPGVGSNNVVAVIPVGIVPVDSLTGKIPLIVGGVSAYDNAFFTDLTEVVNSAGSYGIVTTSLISSGTMVGVYEDKYDGQFTLQSAAAANSGCTIRLGNVNIMPKKDDVSRIWFKTPATIDANTVILFGFSDLITATPQNFTGAQISGTTYRGYAIIGGAATPAGTTATLTAATRYCIEVKYTSDTTADIKLYDSTTGGIINTSSITVTQSKRVPAVIATTTGSVVKDLITVDAMDYKLAKRGVRLPA